MNSPGFCMRCFLEAATRASPSLRWRKVSALPKLGRREQATGDRHLLTATFERDRHRFCPLIKGVVRQSLSWRAGRGAPFTRDEIDNINRILIRLGYKIPSLQDPDFLASGEQ